MVLCPHLIDELVLWAELGLKPGVCDPTACVLQSSGEQLKSCKSKLRDKPQLHLSSRGRRITILTLVSSAKLRGNRIVCSRWLGLCCQGCMGTGCRSRACCTLGFHTWLMALPVSAPAHQPRGRLPHSEDASDRPHCPPHRPRAAQRRVFYLWLHPRPTAHHLPHHPTQVFHCSQQLGPQQPEAPLSPQ